MSIFWIPYVRICISNLCSQWNDRDGNPRNDRNRGNGRNDRNRNRHVHFPNEADVRPYYPDAPASRTRAHGPAPDLPWTLEADPMRSVAMRRELREAHERHDQAQQNANQPQAQNADAQLDNVNLQEID